MYLWGFLSEKFYLLKLIKNNFCYAKQKTTKHQDNKPCSLCTYCSESETKTQNNAVRMCCIHVLPTSTDRCCLCRSKTSKSLRSLHKDVASCTRGLAKATHTCSNLFPASPGDSAWEARWSDPGRPVVGPHPFQASWFHLEGRQIVCQFTGLSKGGPGGDLVDMMWALC